MSFTVTPAGQFNKRIEMQSIVASQSATGEQENSYVTYATVWAKFRTLSGGERIAAQQMNATLTHEITIRYRNDVQTDHRILMGSRTFDIKDVRNVDEANVEIRMRCTEAL